MMTDESEPDTDKNLLRAKLNSETAKIPWSELQRFFAAGDTLFVADELDLVEVAFAFSQDNEAQVKRWLKLEKIAPVSDTQAKEWFNKGGSLWTVVVKPWVLVQFRANR